MSYVNKLSLVQNDYGYDLEFQLTDSQTPAQPVDLTDASTIKVFVAESGASKAKVVGDCTPTNEENGECKYTVEEGDFDEAPKVYVVEIEVTYAGKVVTAKGLVLMIGSELPESTT